MIDKVTIARQAVSYSTGAPQCGYEFTPVAGAEAFSAGAEWMQSQLLSQLTQLQEQVKELQAENEKLKAMAPYVEWSGHYCDGMTEAFSESQQFLDDLNQERETVARLTEALQFYADEQEWHNFRTVGWDSEGDAVQFDSRFDSDLGAKARAALPETYPKSDDTSQKRIIDDSGEEK
jgi:hypothetical protein